MPEPYHSDARADLDREMTEDAEVTYPLRIDTLGKLRATGGGLYAHCTALYAGHGAQLDLDMLIAQYGEDYRFVGDKRIAAACVCKRCGHKGATLRLTVNSRRQAIREYSEKDQ